MNKSSFLSWATSNNEYLSLDGSRRDIAIKCLEKGWEWYNLQPKTVFESASKKNDGKTKKKLKNDCRKYILANTNFKPAAYGYSSVFTSWIFYIVLRWTINWVLKRLLDDWLFI